MAARGGAVRGGGGARRARGGGAVRGGGRAGGPLARTRGGGRRHGGGADGAYDYDLVTIGAGVAVRASRWAAQKFGAKVAICELPFDFVSEWGAKGGAGGTSSSAAACQKLMHYGAQLHDAFADAPHFGWKNGGATPPEEWSALLANKNKEITRLNGIYARLLGNAGVEMIEGHARVTGPNSVSINGRTVTAKNILVATGSTASVPANIPGVDLPGVINSDQALVLPQRPKKVVIYGSGFIAVEFAGIFHGYGSEVHLVYRADHPLRGFDDDCRKFLAEQYAAKGVHMHPGEVPKEVTEGPGGEGLTLVTDKATYDADVVMFATAATQWRASASEAAWSSAARARSWSTSTTARACRPSGRWATASAR